MRINSFLDTYPVILTEGAIIERIKRDYPEDFEDNLLNSGMLYNEKGKWILKKYYKEYLDIGKKTDLPIILLTPTWRANRERLEAGGYKNRNVNADGYRFLRALAAEYGEYAEKVLIGGLMGPKGDAYNPAEALSIDESCMFHTYQAEALGGAGVDFLIGSTIPSLSEATGLAKTMAGANKPYVISFIITPEGNLLDGTNLYDAVTAIDALQQSPEFFAVNCIYPAAFLNAMRTVAKRSDWIKERVAGLQGNASKKSHDELDDSAELDAGDPDEWAADMVQVHRELGTKILGGCCGTDKNHIGLLADKLS